MEILSNFLKLNIHLLYYPKFPYLIDYSGERITYAHKKIPEYKCLAVIAKNEKQFRCLSAGKQIKIMWYIHTIEY